MFPKGVLSELALKSYEVPGTETPPPLEKIGLGNWRFLRYIMKIVPGKVAKILLMFYRMYTLSYN